MPLAKKKKPRPLCLSSFGSAQEDQRNRMLLDWLSDDKTRDALFAQLNSDRLGELKFPSRDAAPRECDCQGLDAPRQPAVAGHKTVHLVTCRTKIETILSQPEAYASRVYAELGGGNFMLALDPAPTGSQSSVAPDTHAQQRQAFRDSFPHHTDQLLSLSHMACQAAAVMSFRQPDFDLAKAAEAASLRYCQLLLGYATKDYRLLERSLRAAYKALVHQVMGRHFVTDPTLIPEAKAEMGRLLSRTSALIDAYEQHDEEALKGCKDLVLPRGVKRVLEALAELKGDLNGEQRATIALGAAVGTVGNVQAAVCLLVQALFKDPKQLAKARDLARSSADPIDQPTRASGEWKKLLAPLLRANPPIPYLPRLKVNAQGRADGELLLALGGATARSSLPQDQDDPLVWGQVTGGRHDCAGRALAWPLIIEIVRQVMALPGLAQGLDPETSEPKGLERTRGFICESYPLTHRRDRRSAQTSLNVAMRIKSPVKDYADRVRDVIRSGAPVIEQALRESRHVHFAWFELIESDTVLVLHTVYDGPFGAYLAHFASRAGDLFDVLFECIENPPPMPVEKFPDEFVAHLLRFDRAPAMGYFFSAYPDREVAQIIRDQGRGP